MQNSSEFFKLLKTLLVRYVSYSCSEVSFLLHCEKHFASCCLHFTCVSDGLSRFSAPTSRFLRITEGITLCAQKTCFPWQRSLRRCRRYTFTQQLRSVSPRQSVGDSAQKRFGLRKGTHAGPNSWVVLTALYYILNVTHFNDAFETYECIIRMCFIGLLIATVPELTSSEFSTQPFIVFAVDDEFLSQWKNLLSL